MKNLAVSIFAAFLLSPMVVLASGLTIQQSSSLINVVQSSPGTPASAFVPLITSFSFITVQQAESLITVVQAAPGAPASAFVDLLVSFTYLPTNGVVDNQTVEPATEQQASQIPTGDGQAFIFITEPKLIFDENPITVDCCAVNTKFYEVSSMPWKTNLPARIENFPINSWAIPPEKFSNEPVVQYGLYSLPACSPWDAGRFYIGKEYTCELNLITEAGSRIKWSKKFILN